MRRKEVLYLLPFASCVFVRGKRRRDLYELSLKCIVFSWCTSRYSSIVILALGILNLFESYTAPKIKDCPKLCYTTRRGRATQNDKTTVYCPFIKIIITYYKGPLNC